MRLHIILFGAYECKAFAFPRPLFHWGGGLLFLDWW
jgi:hypothetical protein